MALLSDRVREAFKSWDTQGDGTITKRGLIHLLRKLAPQVSEDDLEVLFVAAGADAPGLVKYQEFITYLWSEDEDARARGLWEDAIKKARLKASRTWPEERVKNYWDEVENRLKSQEYIDHVRTKMFVQVDQDKDGRVSFDEAKLLICQSLRCAADLTKAPSPTQEEVRLAFDAHDTLVEGRGRMGVDEFVNLARYLQVTVAEAMQPLSKVLTG
ncbi:Calmodulin (CaM) [Durusdinium trenchii]|uniref:Calmodulin (CaM) n=1 Tax=Durusdinium trenchii TaxID=1381693 RepID=A0ABP0MR71_9DINO